VKVEDGEIGDRRGQTFNYFHYSFLMGQPSHVFQDKPGTQVRSAD